MICDDEFAYYDALIEQMWPPPDKHMQAWQAQYLSTCRWAANDIRTLMRECEGGRVLDMLECYYDYMEEVNSKVKDGSELARITRVAMGVCEDIAEYFV